MPLRASTRDGDINAFDYSEAEWEKLKKSYRTIGIQMPCCGADAIPKTSVRGLQYFAHHARGECSSESESAEHLFVKKLVAKGAIAAGWDVKTEWRGCSPSGEEWVADVFAIRGKAKIALEIQLSRQTRDETVRRQQRYKDSGVRAAWFGSAAVFGSDTSSSSQSTPFFLIDRPNLNQVPKVHGVNVPIDEFVSYLLAGNVKWRPHSCRMIIEFVEDTCWNCKQAVTQIFTFYDEFAHESYPQSADQLGETLEALSYSINNIELKALGLNGIGWSPGKHGNSEEFPYCNTCRHCEAKQGNSFVLSQWRRSIRDRAIGKGCVQAKRAGDCGGRWQLDLPDRCAWA